jgi:hypothetical protein
MSFRNILVPVEQHDLMNSTLETALYLAKKFDSYVEGFALRVAKRGRLRNGRSDRYPNWSRMSQRMRNRPAASSRPSCKSMVCRGELTQLRCQAGSWKMPPKGTFFLDSHGRLFDLIVLGRPGHTPKGSRMSKLEAALFETGRPVLVAPPSPRPQMGTNALVAWNCSTE